MPKQSKKAGERTGKFGYWLSEELKEQPQYRVYYDHGSPEKHESVVVIKAFLGDKVTKENKLADVDVMVVNQKNEIILLIEIEESPISPKTLLGDVFASTFSSGFAVAIKGEQRYFQVTPQTRLWVAGYVASKSDEKSDLIHQIQERINQVVLGDNGALIQEVKLIIENNLETCLKRLQRSALDYLVN